MDLLVIISGPKVVFIFSFVTYSLIIMSPFTKSVRYSCTAGLLSVLQTSTFPSSVLLCGADDVEGKSSISSKQKTLLSSG